MRAALNGMCYCVQQSLGGNSLSVGDAYTAGHANLVTFQLQDSVRPLSGEDDCDLDEPLDYMTEVTISFTTIVTLGLRSGTAALGGHRGGHSVQHLEKSSHFTLCISRSSGFQHFWGPLWLPPRAGQGAKHSERLLCSCSSGAAGWATARLALPCLGSYLLPEHQEETLAGSILRQAMLMVRCSPGTAHSTPTDTR